MRSTGALIGMLLRRRPSLRLVRRWTRVRPDATELVDGRVATSDHDRHAVAVAGCLDCAERAYWKGA